MTSRRLTVVCLCVVDRLSDQAIAAVANNNIVTIRKDRDLFDSFKRLKTISDDVLSDKLSLAQQEAVLTNRALVLCLMNKVRLHALASPVCWMPLARTSSALSHARTTD